MHQRLLSIFASSVLLSGGLLVCTAGEVRAADEGNPAAPQPGAANASTAAAPNSSAPTGEKPTVKDEDEDLKRISLEINPLGVAIGRYSIAGEYMVAKHHAVTLSPFFTHVPVTFTVNGKEIDGGSLTGFGGELGYRFYTGSKGPSGFFVGPSFLFSSYSQSAPTGGPPGTAASSNSFTAIGGAVDLGGQAIIGPGIVIGGGAGLQYTSNSEDINTDNVNLASAIIAGGGIRPRFLLSLGYAF